MKFLPLLVILLLIPVTLPAQTSPYKQIDFTWTYAPNLPPCGAQLVACLVGFSLKDADANVKLAGPSVLGPAALSYSYFPAGGVQYGVHDFALTAYGYDQDGKVLASTPATVTINVTVPAISPPGALAGVLQ